MRSTTRSIQSTTLIALSAAIAIPLAACRGTAEERPSAGAPPGTTAERPSDATAIIEGQRIFRYDTFGDEAFWGDTIGLHRAIAGEANGGIGPGVSPKIALAVGLKVDAEALPAEVAEGVRSGTISLDDPATTLALLKLDAVVGVTGFFTQDGTQLRSVGIQCALCHSTVDDSFSSGIGKRRDGWPNRDLNVGAIIALAPDLSVVTQILGVDDPTLRAVLQSWGPGKFDAQVFLDGKAMRPDGKPAASLIPPAFAMGVTNLATSTGWGTTTYWNAFVAVNEMHGKGNFFDPRLDDATRFPVAAKHKLGHVTSDVDLVTSKLAPLLAYQVSLPVPTPPEGSYAPEAASRGKQLFEGRAKCASCHVPPTFTEPGWNLHAPAEIGIDAFQAGRSPEGKYRTTPLGGLFTRTTGGFYHDGRFSTLGDVVDHYDEHLRLQLTPAEKLDLVEYLKSL